MTNLIPYIFRALMYVMFGLSMEVLFSATLLNKVLGYELERRTFNTKYREGFVSVYMIPLYALAILFLFEPLCSVIKDLHFTVRYLLYSINFTAVEVIYAFLLNKLLGFYPWDYYKHSKYKMFNGYSLWTLMPFWGLAGLFLEIYCKLIIHCSPYVLTLFFHYDTI